MHANQPVGDPDSMGGDVHPPIAPRGLPTLPVADASTATERTLRDIVRLLLTPARAGLILSRDDLSRIGARLGFPIPALDRRIMLEHLFMAAGPAGQVPQLLGLLDAEAADWQAIYREWESLYPNSAPIWAEWRGRVASL